MAFATKGKNSNCPFIVIHGIDSQDDYGNSSKGHHIALNVLGIEPIPTPAEVQKKIGNKELGIKSFTKYININFYEFMVQYNQYHNDYADLNYLLNSILPHTYVYIYSTNLSRSRYESVLGVDFYNRFWSNFISEKWSLEAIEVNQGANYDNGSDEVSIKFRLNEQIISD